MITKEIERVARELAVLYVEDDKEVRKNTHTLLSRFFKQIDTAENGEEALLLYKRGEYDLVISDISMPKMDGITLCRHIKQHNDEQYFMVTSAYDESAYLTELIAHGVDQFILKPLNIESFIQTIRKAVRIIADKQLKEEYARLLEESNIDLYEKNRELEKLNNILMIKVKTQKQIRGADAPAGKQTAEKKEKGSTGDENYLAYIEKDDMEELEELEEEIEAIISLMMLSNSFETDNTLHLSRKLERLGSLLYTYPIFMELSIHIKNLGSAMLQIAEGDQGLFKKISIYLESFMYVLTRWKEDVWVRGVTDPNMYDTSLINDMRMICDRITGVENDGGDMELF